jgi:hypothetical protein
MAQKTPTQQILERLPLSVPAPIGTKENLLKLIKIIDSYHDFKPSARCSGSSYHKILDKLFASEIELSEAQVEDFFTKNAINNIPKSAPEPDTRAYFEKVCPPTTLYGTPSMETVPVATTCTSFRAADFRDNAALKLVLDPGFDVSKNEFVGNQLLQWFYPGAPMGTGIGFNFDAQSSLVKDLMTPLNDKTKQFWTYQAVTPQNILDSAVTSFEALTDDKHSSTTGSSPESRTRFELDATEEFSNLFTENIGKFKVQNGANNFSEAHQYEFKWQFEQKDGTVIQFEVNNERNNGPGVEFLSLLIKCHAEKTGKDLLDCCDAAMNTTNRKNGLKPYRHMIYPKPAIEKFNNEANKKYIHRILFDMKRMGDHEQANAVYFRNISGGTKNTIFCTGDILSALYSRLLGNPTIYIKCRSGNSGEAEDEDITASSSSAYLLCYRGANFSADPLVLARAELEAQITQINYILFTFSQIINLGNDSDFMKLLSNLDEYKDSFSVTKSDTMEIENMLIQAKVYNSLAFLSEIAALSEENKDVLFTTVRTLIQLITGKPPAQEYQNSGINMIVVKDMPLAEVQRISKLIAQSTSQYVEQLKYAVNALQQFNSVKLATKTGGAAVFSSHNTLFFSESKMEKSLDIIKFSQEDITHIVSWIRTIKSGRLRTMQIPAYIIKLRESCEEFINSFFSTRSFVKSELLASLPEIMQQVNADTVLSLMMGLFEQIKSLCAPVPKAKPAQAELPRLVFNNARTQSAYSPSEEPPSPSAAAPPTPASAAPATPASAAPPTPASAPQTPVRQMPERTAERAETAKAEVDAERALKSNSSKALQPNPRKPKETTVEQWIAPRRSARIAAQAAKGGGNEDLESVFNAVCNTFSEIATEFPGSLIIVPGNYIKDIQLYPSPKVQVTQQLPTEMRTGLKLPLAQQNISMMKTPTAAYGGNRKRRTTRKIGGDYKYGPGWAGSLYSNKAQAKELADTLNLLQSFIKQGVDVLDKWLYFTSEMESKTPDILRPSDGYSYDVRMTKAYVQYHLDDEVVSPEAKSFPSDFVTKSLTMSEVQMLLDPVETMRVGKNNIITYLDRILKNSKELTNNPGDAKSSNSFLFNFNIKLNIRNIEDTLELIALTGGMLPKLWTDKIHAFLRDKNADELTIDDLKWTPKPPLLPGKLASYPAASEAPKPRAAAPAGVEFDLSSIFTAESKKGGSRKRRTLKNRSNNTRRSKQ